MRERERKKWMREEKLRTSRKQSRRVLEVEGNSEVKPAGNATADVID
jgi:hypothetical protein